MASGRKRRVQAIDASVDVDVSQLMKSTKRAVGKRSKLAGKSADHVIENAENCSPHSTAEAPGSHTSDKSKYNMEETKVFIVDNDPRQRLHPSSKIRLQLFPIDSDTRVGLEKDGLHPYLELTLSARKKISSVVKHLNSKWGGSSVAVGEPILFPFDDVGDLTSYRWTMNDKSITAANVYAALGNPAVFRLRYGWIINAEDKTVDLPCTSTPSRGHLIAEETRKVFGDKEEFGKVKQIESVTETKMISGGTNSTVEDKRIFDRQNEHVVEGGTSSLWADSLTNISIGGLLSEASLQGKGCDARSNGSNAGLQPSLSISDSFDAFLVDQLNHPQGLRPPTHASHSSILDAEDTCHAFAFPKCSFADNDSPLLGGTANSKPYSQDAGAKFEFPHSTEANMQSGNPHDQTRQESETDLKLCSRVYNDESSLGLSGIKWTESLGPFDLGLSSSRKINTGDSISSMGLYEYSSRK